MPHLGYFLIYQSYIFTTKHVSVMFHRAVMVRSQHTPGAGRKHHDAKTQTHPLIEFRVSYYLIKIKMTLLIPGGIQVFTVVIQLHYRPEVPTCTSRTYRRALMAHFHYSAELALSVPCRAVPVFGCASTRPSYGPLFWPDKIVVLSGPTNRAESG